MSRRRQKTSPLEDFITLTSRLPWWAGSLLAIISFIVLHKMAGTKVAPPSGVEEFGTHLVNQMFATLALFGQFIVPAAFGLGAVVSLIKGLGQKKRNSGCEQRSKETPITVKKRAFNPPPPSASPRADTINDLLKSGLPSPPTEMSPEEKPREWSVQVLGSLEWKRFETVCSEYLKAVGFDPKETRIGADGGVDIWVYRHGIEKPVGIVQCKAWKAYKVGGKPVRELYGVMAAEGVAHGKFITSGEFTSEARQFAAGKKLELISGEAFVNWIRKLSAEKQEQLLAIAIEGDYRTPTCPQCGVKMTVRQGGNANKKFWGCPDYPRCRSTLVYKERQPGA